MIASDSNVPASVLTNALERARKLIDAAAQPGSREERSIRRSFRRLFDDPAAVEVTITLTDEVMRFTSSRSAATALRTAVRQASSKGFGLFNVMGLRAVAMFSRLSPSMAVRIVNSRVRNLTENLILDADPASLHATLRSHTDGGLSINVNVLGEAVLGEREANDRLERVLDVVRRSDVNYVSVKLSAIVSQLVTIDHEGSLERVAAKLRVLYREAQAADTFVNLDMEEFRVLGLTLDVNYVSVKLSAIVSQLVTIDHEGS